MLLNIIQRKTRSFPVSKELYECAVNNSRNKIFYTKYGVNDDLNGRFDLLVIHIFIIFFLIKDTGAYKQTYQEVFDCLFKDVEISLREIGVSDISVSRHMKRRMKAFNGSMQAYFNVLLEGGSLDDVISRNLYRCSFDKGYIKFIREFIITNIEDKSSVRLEEICKGNIVFKI